MKVVIAAVAASIVLAGPALSQGAASQDRGGNQNVGASPQYDIIDNQRRTMVRQYIVRERVAPVTLPSGVAVSVGGTLPETVELRTFPSDVGVPQYRYVVVGERTVLVEPSTRRIIQVIE
jgi:hypothetical protein